MRIKRVQMTLGSLKLVRKSLLMVSSKFIIKIRAEFPRKSKCLPNLDNIKPIALPTVKQSKLNLTGKIGETSGWGKASSYDKLPKSHLKYIRETIISADECKDTFNRIKSSQICVSTVGRKSACNGKITYIHKIIYKLDTLKKKITQLFLR